VRSPAPGNTGSAAPGRPCAPVPAFAVALSGPSAPGLGLASAPAWGWSGANRAPVGDLFGVLTPTPALRVGFFCLVGCSEAWEQKHRQKFSWPPCGQILFLAAYGPASTCGCSGSCLTSAVRLPALSLRLPLHLMPALRPPQAAANFSRMVLRRKSPGDRSQPLAQLRAPLPPSRSYFTPWLQPPVPPPVAWHQALSSSLPALPHSYRRLCSLVIPAGSLDAAPSGGKSGYCLFRWKQTSSDIRKSSYRRLKKEAEQRRGWPGRSRLRQASSAALFSRRRIVPTATRFPATSPHPSPAPALGGVVIAKLHHTLSPHPREKRIRRPFPVRTKSLPPSPRPLLAACEAVSELPQTLFALGLRVRSFPV